MRIAGQATSATGWCADFLAVVQQISFTQTPLQECTSIDTGRAVRLEKNQIAMVHFVACMKKVIEAYFKQICSACIAGNVSSKFAICLVSAYHHSQRIPTHQGS